MTIKFTILGCGSSLGVPRPDGIWGNCNPNQKRNYRTRCSAIITSKNLNILIDTSPDLRSQLIQNKIVDIHKVIYSHKHADQTHGINDLRVFYLKSKKIIPVYADHLTGNYLKKNFSYCFKKTEGYPATLKLLKLKNKHQFDNKIFIKTIPVQHGLIKCNSFIINNKCGYASDVSSINNNDLKHFKNLDYFVVDCLRYNFHPSHFNLNQVLNIVDSIKPKKTILTNLHSDIDYDVIKKILPKNIIPGYDGMMLSL